MATVSYADDTPMGAARAAYFAANGFVAGGYDDAWVKLHAGPIPIYFPNSPARVRAVRLHDLHHVLTGYDTTWTGEGEIAAWEIASSCADHYAAWLLNLEAMAVGLAIAPGATYDAFIRGRHSRNLYRTPFDDSLLQPTVGAMRRQLGLGATAPAGDAADRFAFFLWSGVAVWTLAITVGVVLSPLAAVASWLLLR